MSQSAKKVRSDGKYTVQLLDVVQVENLFYSGLDPKLLMLRVDPLKSMEPKVVQANKSPFVINVCTVNMTKSKPNSLCLKQVKEQVKELLAFRCLGVQSSRSPQYEQC